MDSSMDLKSMTLEELTGCVMELGEKKFRAKQIYGWLHQKLVRSPEEMKNVSAKCIEKLLKEHPFYGVEEVEHYESKIDGTQKFLFSLHDGNMVESVLMKYKHGNSVCISSQAAAGWAAGFVHLPCWDFQEICIHPKCLIRFMRFRRQQEREFPIWLLWEQENLLITLSLYAG